MLVQLYDSSWQPISDLVEASARGVTRLRSNQAAQFAFSVPAESVKAADLRLAANVVLAGRLPGRIIGRRISGGVLEVEGITCEDVLNDFKTPRRWVRWQNRDLADVVRDLLRPFRFQRWTTLADFQGAYAMSGVEVIDLGTAGGPSVTLARQAYLGAQQYVASGYIVFRVQLPATALPDGRVVRWTEQVGSDVWITVQTRAASSAAALDTTAWGPQIRLPHAEGIEENETTGADVASSGQWVDIRFNLYTNDRTSVDNETAPTIYGYTPVLQGVELIWREAGPISAGNIPASTGVTVTGYEANRLTHLRALVELCEKYRYTFRVRLVGGQLVLDLAPSFGVDRSADVRLIANSPDANCVLEVLRDSDQESLSGSRRVSVLHCWGAGQGADQLYALVKDDALIAEIGWIEDDYERSDITDYNALVAAGQEELARRKQVKTEAVVQTVPAVLGSTWLQDTVTLIDGASGTVVALPVEEISIQEDAGSGETWRLGLGQAVVDIVDVVLAGRQKPSGVKPVPALAPPVLRAEGRYRAVRLTWGVVPGATGYDIETSEDGVNWRTLASGVAGLRYDHEGLALGSDHWYRAYSKAGQQRSGPSNVVRAKAEDKTPPAPPTGVQAASIIRGIAVRWAQPTEDDYDRTEVRLGTMAGFNPDTQAIKTVVVKGTQAEITEGLTSGATYYARIRHLDDSGNASAWSAEVSAVAGQVQGSDVADNFEIRDSAGNPVFRVNRQTGDGWFKGGVQASEFILPVRSV